MVANKLAGLTNFHVLQTNGALTAVSRNFFILASQHHRWEWHCAAPQQISELLKEGNTNFARCHRSCFDFSLHAGDVAAQLLQAFLPALRICPAALKLVVGEDDLGKLTAIVLHFWITSVPISQITVLISQVPFPVGQDQHSVSLDVTGREKVTQHMSIGPRSMAGPAHLHDNHHGVHTFWGVFNEVPDTAKDLLLTQVRIPNPNRVQEGPLSDKVKLHGGELSNCTGRAACWLWVLAAVDTWISVVEHVDNRGFSHSCLSNHQHDLFDWQLSGVSHGAWWLVSSQINLILEPRDLERRSHTPFHILRASLILFMEFRTVSRHFMPFPSFHAISCFMPFPIMPCLRSAPKAPNQCYLHSLHPPATQLVPIFRIQAAKTLPLSHGRASRSACIPRSQPSLRWCNGWFYYRDMRKRYK